MKKSFVFFLLLTACQSPVQESQPLTAFRACRSAHDLGTREFDNCMREHAEREKNNAHQEKKALLREQGGRDVLKDKQMEIAPKQAPWEYPIAIPVLGGSK